MRRPSREVTHVVNQRSAPPLLAAVLLLSGLSAACVATPAASVAPTAPPSVAATPAPTPAPTAAPPSPVATAAVSASPAPSAAAGQTDTAWGRIWDALPPAFPAYPGAQPAQTGAGPASATLQLPAQVDVAADWTREALEAAGWTIAAANGPLEDGSFVIDATAAGTCKAQVSIAPMGGVTIATVLVGAGCPF